MPTSEQNGSKSRNTGQKLVKPGTFQKGHDPRRNLKGRPRNFDEVRAVAQALAHETEKNRHTAIENVLREWRNSPEPALQKAFVEYAFGKVPDKIESDINLKTKHVMHWPHERPDLVSSNGNRT